VLILGYSQWNVLYVLLQLTLLMLPLLVSVSGVAIVMVMVVVESQPAAFPAMFHDVVTVGVTGPVNVLALQTVLRNQPPSPEMVRDRYEFILPQSTNRPTNKSMGNSSDTWLHFFLFCTS